MSIRPIILCGGTGTRLWPERRKKLPKQFINFFSKDNLLDLTLKRVSLIKNVKTPIIVSNEEYRFHISKALEKYSINGTCIFEPIGRNTTAAIYISSILSNQKDELLFLPSDHLIKNDELFRNTIENAFKVKSDNQWVIFGIQPNEPHTGYGYIKTKNNSDTQNILKKVLKFTEKPGIDVAKYYLKNNFLWNAGIFMGNSKMIINSINKFAPDIAKKCDVAIKNAKFEKNNNIYFNLNDFKNIPSVSIDVSVIEKANNVYCAKCDFDWDDLGNWDSLIKYKKNRTSNKKVVQIDSKNNFIKSNKKVIATVGIKNSIIIDTNDAILIAKKTKSEKVKNVVDELSKSKIFEAFENNFEIRPWGKFENLFETNNCKIKQLTVDPKKSLSLQYHNFRSEHWLIIKGTAKVIVDNKEYKLKKGNSIDIPQKSIHRIINETNSKLIIIEIQMGTYFGEDDIIRIDDQYGR